MGWFDIIFEGVIRKRLPGEGRYNLQSCFASREFARLDERRKYFETAGLAAAPRALFKCSPMTDGSTYGYGHGRMKSAAW